jgi:hypothetical protein
MKVSEVSGQRQTQHAAACYGLIAHQRGPFPKQHHVARAWRGSQLLLSLVRLALTPSQHGWRSTKRRGRGSQSCRRRCGMGGQLRVHVPLHACNCILLFAGSSIRTRLPGTTDGHGTPGHGHTLVCRAAAGLLMRGHLVERLWLVRRWTIGWTRSTRRRPASKRNGKRPWAGTDGPSSLVAR